MSYRNLILTPVFLHAGTESFNIRQLLPIEKYHCRGITVHVDSLYKLSTFFIHIHQFQNGIDSKNLGR